MTFPVGLLTALRDARRIAVLTGAGVSAESGVPTFRDAQTGLWADFRPEELATPEAFANNPQFVWDWYAWRRERVESVAPNPAHYALVELEARVPEFTLITQNVDGLHQRAGSRRVLCLHGDITQVSCFENPDCPTAPPQQPWTQVPRCTECGALLRPAVVWFGEMLPEEAIDRAVNAASNCDLFLSIGTSSLVYPAAALPERALTKGAKLVEINPDETPLSDRVTWVLPGKAGEILPALLAAADLR